MVVEGANDIEFLRRMGRILHEHNPVLPDLPEMELCGELVFVPFGGGRVADWSHRLQPLGKPEWHLYDHELPPETDYRREAAKAVNERRHCQAELTRKRSLENYLHPAAVFAAGEIDIEIDDFSPVAQTAARSLYEKGIDETPWELLTGRSRSRLAYRAKRWLNTRVVECMTPELLRERDPEGELISWLTAIGRLANSR